MRGWIVVSALLLGACTRMPTETACIARLDPRPGPDGVRYGVMRMGGGSGPCDLPVTADLLGAFPRVMAPAHGKADVLAAATPGLVRYTRLGPDGMPAAQGAVGEAQAYLGGDWFAIAGTDGRPRLAVDVTVVPLANPTDAPIPPPPQSQPSTGNASTGATVTNVAGPPSSGRK